MLHMPGDTTKEANTPARKTQLQIFREISAYAKRNSASHPLIENKIHMEKIPGKLCTRESAARSCVEHFQWEACQSTFNVNVPLTATARLSVAGWGP